MNALNKGIPVMTSRSALRKLSPRYPKYLVETVKQQAKKDDAEWPSYMRKAGYTAIAIALPYFTIAYISEAPRLRETLQDNENTESLGNKIVEFVRWWHGKQDDMPYADFLENKDHQELSLEYDVSTLERKEQEMIQERLDAPVTVHVETEAIGDEKTQSLDGMSTADVQQVVQTLGFGNDESSKHVYITFEDEDEENSHEIIKDSEFEDIYVKNDPLSRISKLTSIWSAWYTFSNAPTEASNSSVSSPTTSISASTSNRTKFDSYQPLIDDLNHRIEMLQKELKDPYCIRDRDEMQHEMKEMKKEVTSLKRERRVQKLKSMFSSSSSTR